MARTSSNDGIKEKIGVASVSGHPVDISYIGGSMFEAEFTDIKSKPMQLDRSAMNKLISAGQVKLVSGPRYKEICDAILPDGSTKTHNADGTLKSQVNQMVGQLIEEGYVEGRRPSQDPIPSETRPIQEGTSRGRGSKSSSGPFTRDGDTQSTRRPSPMDPQPMSDDMVDESYDEPAFVEEDLYDGQPERFPMRERTTISDEDRLERKLHEKEPVKRTPRQMGDLNGDGIVDEMDSFVAEEQKKSPLVMVVLFLAALASIGLFFVAFFISSSLLGHDTNIKLPAPAPQEQTQPQEQQTSEGEQEQGQQGSGESGETASRETVVRTDFDPENAVANFEMASEDSQKVAIAMFQAIRTDILNGDVNAFCQAVDIERIASEIAPAYAEYAAGIQNLGEAEKNELRDNYQVTFSQNERQHVVDKDTYASVFGGRIREVRQDPGNPLCIYVVMEAISGDHQRACFALNNDGAGGWTVTDLMDPPGYVQMIAQGGELFQL